VGLFQNLLETYEVCKDAAGVRNETADGEADEKKTFLPIFHTTLKSQICVILDEHGNFINATRDNKDVTIIIPCTEKSAGRASGIAAHPLCDQLDYVGGINAEKTKAYLAGLEAWEKRELGKAKAKLSAVHRYISAGNLRTDLEEKQIFKETELDTCDGTKTLNNEKIRKIGVRFVVYLEDDLMPKVWEDVNLRQSWIDYIKPKMPDQKDMLFDYLSGAPVKQIASQHPKNINSMTGNAKLLSCNDTSGYTFRGRFTAQDDAVIVDYEQSQKMHQTLRWLINNYGYNIDSQTIVIWAVDADTKPQAEAYANSADIWSALSTVKTDIDPLLKATRAVYADYSKALRNFLQGFGKVQNIMSHHRKICIAAFDAATTGRMGLTFYQELFENEYLESIVRWHESASYYLTMWVQEKEEKGKEKPIPKQYIGAPSYDDILFAVYGKARSGNDAGYNTLKRKIRKQLLECMFGNFSFPKSMIDMAVLRASHPESFNNENDWNRSISVSCALVRNYYKELEKEEITLSLDEDRRDRDYLYGRLLAIADELERDTMYKKGKQDERASNAVRLMAAFTVKPYHTWGILHKQLHPYIIQNNKAGYYQSVIDDVLLKFGGNYEDNTPLSPLYLLGFSAQRRFFRDKNKKNNLEDNENDITE